MAAIDMAAKATAVGVGALDELFESMDDKAGRVEPFRKWADFERLGGTIISIATEVMGRGGMATLARNSSGSFITLLTKSIAKPIRGAIGSRSMMTRTAGSVPTALGPTPMPSKRVGAYQPIFPRPRLY